MNNNAIVIINFKGFPQIISTEGCSEKHISEAIGKAFKIDAELIEHVCSNGSSFYVYGVKELCPGLEGKLSSLHFNAYSANPPKHFHYIQIILGENR